MSTEGPAAQEGQPQEQAQGQPVQLPIPIGPNGERPTPEQIRQIHEQITAEAERLGISVQEYVERIRQQALAQQQAQMQAQQQAQQHQPIQPGPPKPEALALANWLKSQELKPRTVVHDEKRKDMFRGMKRPKEYVDDNVVANYRQSSEPFAPSNPQRTKKPDPRILSSPKSPTALPPRTLSSFCLFLCSHCVFPKWMKMRMKVIIMRNQNA